MTITLQAVNELIASLESAGELSIREQKFLKLAKAFKQLAAENMALKSKGKELLGEACAVYSRLNKLIDPSIGDFVDGQTLHEFQFVLDAETPASDRIVAGIKADGVAEREKTITFTAAKKRTQDGVALIAIGKPYKIHNDDVIGEFFIGERGRYGVITMDRLNYFATSDEYAWAFSLREGADK
ncbi:hypothetical protein [Klebsiella variicola]|uniref:hypothetical protein n=1 Tax=Klebsiella variicola TaxID=244366 RepID=UPI00214E5757|nr:hypothetical protein [Klebsiella variicola]MCR3913034.1 hypothetical protein [Klebsiella variicola]